MGGVRGFTHGENRRRLKLQRQLKKKDGVNICAKQRIIFVPLEQTDFNVFIFELSKAYGYQIQTCAFDEETKIKIKQNDTIH